MMEAQKFTINTLHRRKYMISFMGLLILVGIISSVIPASEILKVIFMLFTIPLIIFLSVKLSINKSIWILDQDSLTISFADKSINYLVNDIDHIRSLTRSGGNLYVIYRHKKSPHRYWRNKLFIGADDHEELHVALTKHAIEYFKM